MSPSAIEALARPIADPITGGAVAPDFELEVMRRLVDVDQLLLEIVKFKNRSVDIRASVTAADVELSIDSAHQLTIVVHDSERSLQHSGALDFAIDINIHGWWWRLVRRNKSGNDITLTFEPRAVAWLRSKHGVIKARRGKVTRAEFILMMIRAVKRHQLQLFCPELHKRQPIASASQRDTQGAKQRREPGLDQGFFIKIDGKKASDNVMQNLDRALTVGSSKGVRRKLQVATVMCILQESRGKTSATNGSHVGLFQQDPRYWPATREPERDAAAWYDRLVASDKASPRLSLTALIESVQRSGQPDAYGKWRDEAEDVVNHFYKGGDTGPSTDFTITRKLPYEFRVKKEDKSYWGTIIRLAEEVSWSIFTIKDRVNFISQTDLFRSKSLMTIKEGIGGVDWIDWDDDSRKPVTEVTVSCHMAMWSAPIGTVVTVEDDCPADGRYLVVGLARSYFSTSGTVTLRKPVKERPEPAPEIVTNTLSSGAGSDMTSGGAQSGGPVRDRIVKHAKTTLTSETGFRRYDQNGALTYDPMPKVGRTDCSQWTRAIFHHVTGEDIGANTWAQIANGRRTSKPKPGDLMFPAGGGHVEIYLGAGNTIGHGSPPIDYARVEVWPRRFYITYDFLDGILPGISGPAPQTTRQDF